MRQPPLTAALLALTLLGACTPADSPTASFGAPVEPNPAHLDAQLARSAQAQTFVPGRVLARFHPGAPVAALVEAEGAVVQRQLALGIRLLTVPPGRERAVAEALRRSPFTEFAEPDFYYVVDEPCGTGTCTVPTDGFFGFRWDLHNDGSVTDGQGVDLVGTGAVDADMDWLEAFDVIGPLPGPAVIGIIDTGILPTHQDLAGKVVAGYDFFDSDPDPADDHGHGTHVAGIAAAHGNDGTGVPGVAWTNEVGIAAAKVCGYLFGFLHGCPSSAIADGILWATDNGADVLNISLGGAEQSAAVQSALQYARQNGVLPVCAAGNDGGPVAFPGAFPECVAVSATDWGDELASYSNYGPEIELAAPGGDFEDPDGYSFILSTYYSGDDGYAWLAGTSMASPQVAGLAGLLHALGVTDPDDKLTRMRATANDLGTPGDDTSFGAGRINVYTAVADLVGAPGNQVPNASFTASCTDLTCAFTDTSTDGEGSVVAWSWDFGDGTTSTLQHPDHTYAVAGTYTVTLVATDDEGATDTFSMDVTVPVPNVPPTASFSASCDGYTCDFTDTSTDSDGAVASWSWDFGDGATSTARNPSHTYATTGTFTVTLTVTDDDGDSDSSAQNVTATEPNGAPTASFTSSCTDMTCDFTNTSTDGDGTIVASSWDFGDGWTSNGTSPSHTYFDPGTYTVTLIVWDDGSKTDTVTADVTATEPGEAPTASFTTRCTDLTCDFTDTSTDPQGSVVAWAWDFGDGTSSSVQHPSHTYAAAGTYTVTLTATDAVGASDTSSRDVTVPSANQAPAASFTSACADLSCDFTDTSLDGDGTVVAWSWDFGDGGSSTLQSPSHSYAAPGMYAVTLTATDDDGATDSFSATVTAMEPNEAPVASFTWSCDGLVCQFTDTSTDVDGAVSGHGWTFGDGWSSNGANPTHTYEDVGTYRVTLTATDDDGASDTFATDVTVVGPGEAPMASFTSSCVDLSCDFTDASTQGSEPIVSWWWDFGDGTGSGVQHPGHLFSAAGSYDVTLTVADGRGVDDTFTRTITVPSANQPPTASFASSCGELTCAFTDTSVDGDGTVAAWSWNFGDGGTSTGSSPSHTYSASGTYTVTLTVTDDDGATDTALSTVTVVAPNQAPTASFTHGCSNLMCDFTDTSTDGDGVVAAHQWAFGDGWSSNGASPSHTYTSPGTYTVTLTVTDDDGATDTFSADVTIDGPNQVPAASFTSSCADLTCSFTDTSTDGDGSIVAWSWDFGDGGTSAGQSPSHGFAAAGSYTVTLTVADDGGATDTATGTVTVTSPPAVLTLTAVGYKVRGLHKADLTWSGATSGDVDVYRDGVLLFTTANDGFETDHIDQRGSGSYTYQVCETGTVTCTGEVTITF